MSDRKNYLHMKVMCSPLLDMVQQRLVALSPEFLGFLHWAEIEIESLNDPFLCHVYVPSSFETMCQV